MFVMGEIALMMTSAAVLLMAFTKRSGESDIFV
jgi:hypothetical protein